MSEINRDPERQSSKSPETPTGRLLSELVEDQLRSRELTPFWEVKLETDEVAINTIRTTQCIYEDGMVHRRELTEIDDDVRISEFMEAEDNHVFADITFKNAPKDSYGSRLNIKLRDDGKACGVLSKEVDAHDIFGVIHTHFEATGMAGETKLSVGALDSLQSLAMIGAKLDTDKLTYDDELEINYLAEDLLHEVQDMSDETENAPELQRLEVAKDLIDYCEFSGQPTIGLSVRHELDDQVLLIECDPLDGGYLEGNTRIALTLGHPDGPSHNFVQLRQTYDGKMNYFIRKPALDGTISRSAKVADMTHFLKALLRIS